MLRAWRKGDWQALARLQLAHPHETAEITLNALSNPHGDYEFANSFIGIVEKSPQVRDKILSHLANNKDSKVRGQCAMAFMADTATSPKVLDAFLRALKDPSEQVVSVVCTQLGLWGGEETIKALFGTLSHPSWMVRLSVCQALMQLQVADTRVVAALERMAHEPEATVYNAVMDKFKLAPWDKEGSFDRGKPAKIEDLLAQAQQLAAKRHKHYS